MGKKKQKKRLCQLGRKGRVNCVKALWLQRGDVRKMSLWGLCDQGAYTLMTRVEKNMTSSSTIHHYTRIINIRIISDVVMSITTDIMQTSAYLALA